MKFLIEVEVEDEEIDFWKPAFDPATTDWAYVLRMGGFPAESAEFQPPTSLDSGDEPT